MSGGQIHLTYFPDHQNQESGLWLKDFYVVETISRETGCPRILIHDVDALSPYGFDLKGTFESGQCFRWKAVDEGRYFGIVRRKAVTVSLCEKKHLLIENATAEDFCGIWHDYFDLAVNYAPLLEQVDKDAFMHGAVSFSGGARLLRQDFEETLFSYILSAQNNIPRIKKLIENLCEKYGEQIPGITPDAMPAYSFPTSAALSRQFCLQNRPGCKSGNLCENPFGGYRCPYIRRTADMLAANRIVLDFDRLAASSAREAREFLCQFPGVGEKVADCVLLYSGIRQDICPIDTWVEKTIQAHYLGQAASKNDIRAFTESYFGRNAGYAQLWFFYYARSHPDK